MTGALELSGAPPVSGEEHRHRSVGDEPITVGEQSIVTGASEPSGAWLARRAEHRQRAEWDVISE
jgi:hypothetical protein